MITITNTIKTPITGALQKLPINKYLIFEAGDHLTESLEQSDVLLLDVKTAQQMRKMDTATLSLCAILLYVETEEMSAGTYELAKEIGVHAIFSNADMKKLQLLIDQAYDSIVAARKKSFSQGKSIGVVSIKGGVGRSILSYHLALQLNAYTKSEPLLIDACVPLGSAKALLHIEPKVSWQVLRPLLKTGKDLTANRLASQVTKTNWQFHLLCAPSEWNEESLSASELGNLLHTARESFPITIVDLPSVKPSEFMEYARHFDLLIWVFTPDATSIQHTLELQAQLNKETLDKDIKKPQMLFVCNMYEPSFDATLIKSVGSKLAQLKVFLIDADPEAVKTHQRKFELLSDDTLLLTSQIKELAKHAFFTLTGI